MKKSLIFVFIFLLVIAGFVSANSSECIGNDCILYEGETVTTQTGHNIELSFLEYNAVKLTIDGETLPDLYVGDNFLYGDIKIFIDKINVPPQFVHGEAGSVEFRVESQFEVEPKRSNCTDNICTLYEGETLNVYNNNLSIVYASNTETRLIVDQETTDILKEGSSFENSKIKITITKQDLINHFVVFTVKDKTSKCENNLCTLYEYQNVSTTIGGISYTFSIESLSSYEVKLKVNGEQTNNLNEGSSQVIGGIKIKIDDIIYSSQVGLSNSVVLTLEELEPVSFCSENTCTLYEGQSIVNYLEEEGYNVSLEFIDSSEVKLKVNGEQTNNLNEGSSQVIGGIKIKIDDIIYSSQADAYNKVVFSLIKEEKSSYCSDGLCILYEGQNVTEEGYQISIDFISSNNVKLNVDGETIGGLSEGDTYELGNIKINVKEINFSSIKTALSSIEFEVKPISRCEEGLCTLYENQSVTNILNEKSYNIFISFMSSSEVILNINGQETNKLNEGDSLVIEGIRIYVEEIMPPSHVGSIGSIVFKMAYVGSCDGCMLDGKCYSLGYRKSGEYCSEKGDFIKQKESRESCENSFECKSNLCIDDECIEGGIIKKIISWFKRVFGRE